MEKFFGTDGVRGIANRKLTPILAYRIGRYIGIANNGHRRRIVIARDTRISGDMLLCSLTAGILASGGDVYDLGVSTTPSVSYLVRKNSFDYGIMISASHNPYFDNGIKVFNSEGEKISHELESEIEEYIKDDSDCLPLKVNSEIGKNIPSKELLNDYLEFLCNSSTNISGIKVLVDGANGSASKIAQDLFNRLGVEATFINVDPNGVNINDRCGSTHLDALSEAVGKGNYDIGLAFDGDADRLLAVAHDGRIIDGDAIIYMCAKNLKKKKLLVDDSVVITTMSNLGLRKALEKEQIKYEITDVGDKYVQARLKEKGFVLGGEQSGHIIFLNHLNTGDGLLSAIQLLNIISLDGPLEHLLKDFMVYPQVLKNVASRNKKAVLDHQGLKHLVDQLEKELGNDGRILIRPSGTEPLIRVMCEAKTMKDCQRIVDACIQFIDSISY